MRAFALETYFARWESAVRHNLAASESEPMRLSSLLAMADAEERARWEGLGLGYTDPLGAPWLRETIAGLYAGLGPEAILCFAGAEEGLFCAMRSLLGPDDHAIVVTPNYQSLETVPLSLCAVTGVPLDPDRGWTLDVDAVAAAIRPRTRLVAVNFPHNPTGKILERDRFDALVALCRRHGLWLFSDEVYRLIERDPALRLPQAADCYERGVSLNVLSKAYGLPGLRIGWVACQDRALLERMSKLKDYLSICNAAPSEVLAQVALRNGERILAANRDLASGNLALAEAFLGRHPDLFTWHRPEGGVTLYPRYGGAEGVEAFAQRLVTEAGVLVLPASVFRSELLDAPADGSGWGSGGLAWRRGLRRWVNISGGVRLELFPAARRG